MAKRQLPESIDLSILEFLEFGDRKKIADEDRKAGRKTSPQYVSEVLKGRHRNHRILGIAIDIALKKKAKFPQQVLKS